jgi:hypothetical protein
VAFMASCRLCVVLTDGLTSGGESVSFESAIQCRPAQAKCTGRSADVASGALHGGAYELAFDVA